MPDQGDYHGYRAGTGGWQIRDAGAGVAVLKSTPVTLTDDQIKALPTTSIELIPAPGAGKIIVPTIAYLVAHFQVEYGGIDDQSNYPYLWVGPAGFPLILSPFNDEPDTPVAALSSFLGSANNGERALWLMETIRTALAKTDGPPYVTVDAGTGLLVSGFEGLSLKIGASNSVDFTGGDPANTLTVTVFYTVLDV